MKLLALARLRELASFRINLGQAYLPSHGRKGRADDAEPGKKGCLVGRWPSRRGRSPSRLGCVPCKLAGCTRCTLVSEQKGSAAQRSNSQVCLSCQQRRSAPLFFCWLETSLEEGSPGSSMHYFSRALCPSWLVVSVSEFELQAHFLL